MAQAAQEKREERLQDRTNKRVQATRTRSAVDILRADETLSIAYLLSNPAAGDPAALTEEAAARFLLWFAIEGRRRFQHVMLSPSYLEFLATPVPPYPTRLAAFVLLGRPDIRKRFEGQLDRMLAWYRDEAVPELGLAPLSPVRARGSLPGVNVVGFGNNVMGIGEDVRAMMAALERAGAPRVAVNIELSEAFGTLARDAFAGPQADRPLFPVSVFALPPFEMARLHVERGTSLFHRRYAIGYWPWELTSLPEPWHVVFDLVDEVWASSEYLLDVYRKLTRKPVLLVPPCLNAGEPEAPDLARHGVTEGDFLYLTMFDFNSFIERKNPQGAIAAFQKAFPSRGNEKLIVKTINAHSHADARRRIEALAGKDDRVVFIHDAFSRAQTLGLLARVDCLVSLHRAEGFGRILAEAMAMGTPVVATDWSGSASFLDDSTGYPVTFTLKDVRAGEYIYHHGSQWAEPSIEHAVTRLREARDGVDPVRRVRARSRVDERYGLDPVAAALASRLGAIAQARPDLMQ